MELFVRGEEMNNRSDGSTAANILRAAIGHMDQRASTYDKPGGERSMGSTVLAFAAITGVLMTEEQGWLFMALLKAVRTQQGAYRADSYEDGAAYFALAGEAAARDRATSVAPLEMQDDSDRMAAIGQNGNDGEVYESIYRNAGRMHL